MTDDAPIDPNADWTIERALAARDHAEDNYAKAILEREALRTRSAGFESQRYEAIQNMDAANAQAQQVTAVYDAQVQQIATLTAQVGSLTAENAALGQQNNALSQENQTLAAQAASLSSSVDVLSASVAALNAKLIVQSHE